METSLRYSGDSKSLKVHAKEKIPIASNTLWQINGELDTRIGAPTYVNSMIRHFDPVLSATLDVGVQYNRNQKFHYHLRAKKAFQVTADGLVNFHVKGRCDADEEFKKVNYSGAAEFIWNIYEFKKDQDLRLKLGYDVSEKLPYFQVQENNWTFNADGNLRWNVRYNL